MNSAEYTHETDGEILCKACGLCCTGHFFTWVGLDSAEVASALSLGLSVEQYTETDRANFHLPCPLWNRWCSIYTHPDKPHTCSAWECKLLQGLKNGDINLDQALMLVHQTKALILELEQDLPSGQNGNFRQRLASSIELLEKNNPDGGAEAGQTLLKAGILLSYYSRRFGIIDLFNQTMGEKSGG